MFNYLSSNSFKILILLSLIPLIAVVYYLTNPLSSPPIKEASSRFTTAYSTNLDLEKQWIVSGEQAKKILSQEATLLDTRSFKLLKGKIPGAKSINWQDFSQAAHPHRGKLLGNEEILTQKLQKLGIEQNHPVVVFGDPLNGWGEEGRIVWMLRALGHNQTVLVDGGYQTLLAAKIAFKKKTHNQGNFVVQLRKEWEVNQEELKASLLERNFIVVDTRELREYKGQTPYGEDRGGHIPGAIHLHYKELLGKDGKLRARKDILSLLAVKGIGKDKPIVSYCTGGVRSAWLTAVLNDLGFQAKNYPGSMWEWSSFPADVYPLLIE